MLKRFNVKPAHLWLLFAVLAVSVMIWKGCKKDPDPVINVPELTGPSSVTSEPTQAELDLLEREKQRRIDHPTNE